MNAQDRPISRYLKIGIVILWVTLFAMLLQRDVFLKTIDLKETAVIEKAESEEYRGIYFKRDKIGYVMQRYKPIEADKIELVQEGYIKLNVAGAVQAIDLRLRAFISNNSRLQSFTFAFSSPFYNMKATGEVKEKTVHYTIDTGTNKISSNLSLSNPPLLNTARRSYLFAREIEAGDKIKIPWFDPISLTGKESVVEYKGEESIQIGGRIEKLHHFIESFSGTRINLWLNNSGKVIKEESPAGFVFIREPKFRALQLDTADQDILSAVAVKLPSPLIVSEKQMVYQLGLPGDVQLDLQGGRQYLKDDILVIKNEIEDPSPPPCSPATEVLGPTPYIQSEHKTIVELARKLTENSTDAMETVQTIASWVYKNIDKRPVLGLPDALTTLTELRGDCNEHAALFAALSRAAGVPTRVVAGVTSHKNGLYYHAWNEVCVANRWLSVDTTMDQLPADLTHIRLIIGEMQEQVKISAIIGKLTVTQVAESGE